MSQSMLGRPRLLYGALHVAIFEGKNCISEAPVSQGVKGLFKGVLEVAESAVGYNKKDSDCYVTVDLHTARVGRTRVISGTVNPTWNERFIVYCAHEATAVKLTLKDDEALGAQELGTVQVPVENLLSGQPVEGWQDVLDGSGKKVKTAAMLNIRLQFFEASADPAYGMGVGDGTRHSPAINHVYFPLRAGCKARLYQDAHVKDGVIPDIYLQSGKLYEPPRCWEDIYSSIVNARHFIYIAGWAVYDKITLVRDPTRSTGVENVTLGELLKKKAEEGVMVNLLVWDDKTSMNSGLLRMDGIMSTHDEDTGKFFRGSKVHCVLCPRNPDDSLSWWQGMQIGTLFTHHQKTVIVDAAVPEDTYSGKRRVEAFVGGIDLCNGRYDNQEHALFTTLNTIHEHDFHQSCIEGAELKKGGPREPWHDIHSRVEGPAAWDILYNFEQRWLAQAGKANEHLLLPITEIPAILPPAPVTHEDDPEAFNIQILRSIDTGSVGGFPENPEDIFKAGLVSGKGNVVDRSAQDGYIQAIRRAKNFIYIENQYFLGGCHMWEDDQSVGCFNLVPVEIALKICDKIKRGERFVAYINIPLFPDGIPNAGSTQEILFWETRTKAMMYGMIARALRDNGRYDEHPKDYLSFFCLGNRQAQRPEEYVPEDRPEKGSPLFQAQVNRRFMIYIHAKLLIVDDEFVIIGSANINQRSLDGSRDSEICMSGYQPAHTMATSPGGAARGQIHGFRMSLWGEHVGYVENSFLRLESLECVRRLNEIAYGNWERFTGEEVVDMPSHLMAYPVDIRPDGSVGQLGDHKFIPDTDGLILGKKSGTLPDILTT